MADTGSIVLHLFQHQLSVPLLFFLPSPESKCCSKYLLITAPEALEVGPKVFLSIYYAYENLITIYIISTFIDSSGALQHLIWRFVALYIYKLSRHYLIF